MRPVLAVTGLLLLAPAVRAIPVFDAAALRQSLVSYTAMTKQIANQATQINHQIQQVQQMEAQLKRAGDMANFKNLVGFAEFKVDLSSPTQIRTWAQRTARVDGTGLFGDTRGGIFADVRTQFTDFDGKPVNRDPALFKQSHAVVATVDEFKTVQTDVYQRRETLKQAIGRTGEAMQAATTEAEQQKLQAVMTAQYGQLRAVDAEVELSAAEVQVKTAEAAAMNNAKQVAEAETRSHLAQREAGKVSTTFVPSYECILQFVTERPLAP